MKVSEPPSFKHPPDSGILDKNKTPISRIRLVDRLRIVAIPEIWINRIIHRCNIHQKIRYGYILSLGIAVLGTGTGLIVGEHYDDKVVEKYRFARDRYELIANFEKSVLIVNLYQKNVALSPSDSQLQKNESAKLIKSINDARQLLAKLKLNLKDTHEISADEAIKLKELLENYDTELESFTQLVQLKHNKSDIKNSSSSEIQAENKILEKRSHGKLAPQFEQLSIHLQELVNSTLAQRSKAEESFKKVKVLRVTITVASMLLSIAIALALAFYTSRAIARPIKAVTHVAKRATQESNFNLQAPVTTEDEIGVLASSLNQLIQQVATQIRELQQAQAQLIQSEKMSSLGQVVAGIAHEINNPATFIYANLKHANDYIEELLDVIHLYQKYYPQSIPEIQTKLEEIEFDFLNEDLLKILSSMHVGADRIRQIVLSLRNFCHLDEAEIKSVDINKGIDNTLLILNHRLQERIEIIKQYSVLPLVECYPAQLNQLFMHIISNAIDEILTSNELADGKIFIQTRSLQNEQIEICIKDNGSGIAPEIKDKIFDPFFSTKPVGKGMGMGLAISYQIVEKHQGKIDVISEPGQGATFVVTLPICMISKVEN